MAICTQLGLFRLPVYPCTLLVKSLHGDELDDPGTGHMKNLCVCLLCLYSVWVCVIDFLCDWMHGVVTVIQCFGHVKLFFPDTLKWRVQRWQVISYTPTVMTSMHVWQAYTLDLNFGFLMHSPKSTLAWRKTSYDWCLKIACTRLIRPEKGTCTRGRKWTFKTILYTTQHTMNESDNWNCLCSIIKISITRAIWLPHSWLGRLRLKTKYH